MTFEQLTMEDTNFELQEHLSVLKQFEPVDSSLKWPATLKLTLKPKGTRDKEIRVSSGDLEKLNWKVKVAFQDEDYADIILFLNNPELLGNCTKMAFNVINEKDDKLLSREFTTDGERSVFAYHKIKVANSHSLTFSLNFEGQDTTMRTIKQLEVVSVSQKLSEQVVLMKETMTEPGVFAFTQTFKCFFRKNKKASL